MTTPDRPRVTIAVPAVVYVEVFQDAMPTPIEVEERISQAVRDVRYEADGYLITVEDYEVKHAQVLDPDLEDLDE